MKKMMNEQVTTTTHLNRVANFIADLKDLSDGVDEMTIYTYSEMEQIKKKFGSEVGWQLFVVGFVVGVIVGIVLVVFTQHKA